MFPDRARGEDKIGTGMRLQGKIRWRRTKRRIFAKDKDGLKCESTGARKVIVKLNTETAQSHG